MLAPQPIEPCDDTIGRRARPSGETALIDMGHRSRTHPPRGDTKPLEPVPTIDLGRPVLVGRTIQGALTLQELIAIASGGAAVRRVDDSCRDPAHPTSRVDCIPRNPEPLTGDSQKDAIAVARPDVDMWRLEAASFSSQIEVEPIRPELMNGRHVAPRRSIGGTAAYVRAAYRAAQPMIAIDARLPTLTPDQRRIVEWGDGPVVVIAGAGTGKTRVIVERVRHLLDDARRPAARADPRPDLQREGGARSCATGWTRRVGAAAAPACRSATSTASASGS